MPLVTEREFFHFIAIILAATGYETGGKLLWSKPKFASFFETPDFSAKFDMAYDRFDKIKKFFFLAFRDPSVDTQGDQWWPIRGIVAAFDNNRQINVAAGFIIVLDESMSAWAPQTTKTGGLPHISYILRKPEPLGTELKDSASAALRKWLDSRARKANNQCRKRVQAISVPQQHAPTAWQRWQLNVLVARVIAL